MNWLGKKNGELLRLAVENKFEIFITVDKNLKYQINIKKSAIGFIVLDIFRIKIDFIKPHIGKITKLLPTIKPYEIHEVR